MRKLQHLAPAALLLAVLACGRPDASDSGDCDPAATAACGPDFVCDPILMRCVKNALKTPDAAAGDAPRADAPVTLDAPPAGDAPSGAARLTVNEAAYTFGTVVLGQSGGTRTFTVTNGGDAPSIALDVVVGGGRAASFVVDPASTCLGAVLRPGEACTVSVTFRPDATGAIAGSLEIAGVETIEVALAGEGVAPGQLELTPASADLGEAVVGSDGKRADFTLRNAGGAPLALAPVALSGSGASAFRVAADGCGGKTLAGGATCALGVVLHPAALGGVTATLAISSPRGAATAMLAGRGIAPASIHVDPAALDLGTTVIGIAAEATITAGNPGGVASGVLAAELSGAATAEVTILRDGCSSHTLAPGGSCTITIQALPDSPGPKSVSLAIRVAGATAATVAIATTAIPPGALTVTPTTQPFGATLMGSDGETHRFTIKNTGGAPTGKIETALTGTGLAAFRGDADGCAGKELAGGASCEVAITFHPKARQSQSATLVVKADPGGGASASLSGTGLLPAALAGDATAFDLGTVDVGATGLAQVLTIRNGGDVASGPLSTTVAGDLADFSLTQGCPQAPLDPGQSCAIGVALAPATGGGKALTVSVSGAPGGSVTLSAAGLARPPSTLAVTRAGNGHGQVGSMPAGVDCGAACSADYRYGTPVTLVATPADDSTFGGWSGACAGGGACQLGMTEGRSVGATFTLKRYPLSVEVAGSGTVTSDPAGVSCGLACSASFDHGTPIKLKAVAAVGWSFSGWTGCPSPNGDSCSLTLTQPTPVKATFALIQAPVTLSVSADGTVTSKPAGLACAASSVCDATFAYGTQLVLTAAPDANHHLGYWTGACAGVSGLECTLTVGVSPIAAGAQFFVDRHALSLNPPLYGTVTGGGLDCGSGGTVCSVAIDAPTQVTLTATPDAHHHATAWGGDCAGATCTLTMDKDHVVSVSFPIDTYLLSVTPPTGGYVQSTVANGILCGSGSSVCSKAYDDGAQVTLRAYSDNGYRVGAWGGACAGVSGDCTLTMDQARTVSATFIRQVTLTLTTGPGTVSGAGSCGSVANQRCTATFDAGTALTLKATPSAGYGFAGWLDACSGTGDCALTMNGDRAAEAKFEQRPLGIAQLTNGWVTGPGISCVGGPCSYLVPYGASITLTANPAPGYHLVTWDGDCSGPTCTVSMTAAHGVGAQFAVNTSTLSLTSATGGAIDLDTGASCGTSCSYALPATSTVALTPHPAAGYRFDSWGSDCSGSGACSLSMDQPHTVTASWVRQYTLTVIKPTNGLIRGGVINCGGVGNSCSVALDKGTQQTLSAFGTGNYHFTAWGSDCLGQTTCAPVMDADHTVSATFAIDTRTLSLTVGGSGYVIDGTQRCTGPTSCNWAYDYGTPVTLTATPATGYDFGSWSVCGGTASGNTCTVTMDMARVASVTFTPHPYTVNFSAQTGNAWGYVTSNDGKIDCAFDAFPSETALHTKCSAQWPYGTNIKLTAHAIQDSEAYAGAWTGCNSTSGIDCLVTINGDRTLKPNFYGDGVNVAAIQFGGTGYIYDTTGHVRCGDIAGEAHCKWRFHWSSDIILRKEVTHGQFGGWTGCDWIETILDGEQLCHVSASGTKIVHAGFVQ